MFEKVFFTLCVSSQPCREFPFSAGIKNDGKKQEKNRKEKMTEKMLKNKLSFFANSNEIFFPPKKKSQTLKKSTLAFDVLEKEGG